MEVNKTQRKKVLWISIASAVAVVAVLLIVVAVIDVTTPRFKVCRGESGEALNSCLMNESRKVYANGGVQAVLDIYDNYIELARDEAEKRDYTIYKVEGLNEACNYECQQEIRDAVDSLMGLEENYDSVATICLFGNFYSRNQKYIEYCNRKAAMSAEGDDGIINSGEGENVEE